MAAGGSYYKLPKETQEELLKHWYKKTRVLNKGHWETSERLKRRGLWGGALVVLLTAIVGSEIFVNLAISPNFAVQLSAGVLSIVVVGLSAVLNFLHFPERAERHRQMGIGFGNLKRKVHAKLTGPKPTQDEMAKFLEEVRNDWYGIAQDEPSIPQELFKKVNDSVMSPPTIP